MTEDFLSEPEKTIIASVVRTPSSVETGEIELQVLSGEGAGKKFAFAYGQNVVIGRQEDSHICLIHNLISRHHTKIQWKGKTPWLVDLGSTNGTFYLGKRIKKVQLKHGDRFQVGNSTFKLILKSGKDREDETETRIQKLLDNAEKLLKKVDQKEDPYGRIFSGSIEKIKLTEILQSLSLGNSEGILVIQGPQLGKIYLRKGGVFYARVEKIVGKKALFRILSWKDGHFDLRPLEDEMVHEMSEKKLQQLSSHFTGDITSILLEFFKYQDDIINISLALYINPCKLDPHSRSFFKRYLF